MNSSNSVVRSAREACRCFGEGFVERGSLRLGDRLVGGIPEQDVAEPEPVRAAEIGGHRPKDVLQQQAAEVVLDATRALAGDERAHRRAVEHLAHDRRGLHDPPLLGRESVQARGEQGRDRGRDLHVREVGRGDPLAVLLDQDGVVDEHRQHLLDEQRVPVGGRADALADLGRERRVPEQVLDQRVRLGFGERFEVDAGRVALAPAPARAVLQELGARHADEEDRDVAGPRTHVFDHLEQRRLCPVDVVEHGDERSPPPERLEEPADRPRGLDRPRAVQAEHPGQVRGDGLAVRCALEQLAEFGPRPFGRVVLRDAGGLDRHLGDRPEGDALAVGQAASREHLRSAGDRGDELPDQARLADARRPQAR